VILSKEQVAEIRARAGKATKGEWRLSGCDWILAHNGETVGHLVCTVPSISSECYNNGRFIAASRTDIPNLLDSHEELRERAEAAERARDEVKAVIERERTSVCVAVRALEEEVKSRSWLQEGRGCYEWNDDRYREEFGYAADAIKERIEPLRKIGTDLSNSPTTTEAAIEARRDLRAELTKAHTERDRLAAENAALRDKLQQVVTRAEQSYWSVRKALDDGDGTQEWVRGDDWPCYPLIAIARGCADFLAATPQPEATK
jgi:hypothetical protein